MDNDSVCGCVLSCNIDVLTGKGRRKEGREEGRTEGRKEERKKEDNRKKKVR